MTATPADVMADAQHRAWAQGYAAALYDREERPDAPLTDNPFPALPTGDRPRVEMIPGLPRCPACGTIPRPAETIPAWVRPRYQAGHGASELARILNDADVPTLRGAKTWWPSTIRSLVMGPSPVRGTLSGTSPE